MTEVDWQQYATTYDLLLQHNPAYQDILTRFKELMVRRPVPQGASVIELGAGTGNYSIAAARLQPGCQVIHVDNDPGMNARANSKREAAGLTNLIIHEESAVTFDYTAYGTIGAIVAIHALYTFPDPLDTLQRMYDAVMPGGFVVLCDLGRVLNLNDWRTYLFREIAQREGYLHAINIFWQGREISRQNQRIRARQSEGVYWVHTPQEFMQAVSQVGFVIEESDLMYRGYSDFVLAHKPTV